MQNSNHQLTGWLLLLFTLLQLFVLLLFGYTPYPDSEGYVHLANECLSKHDLYPITSELCEYPFLWNSGAINAVVASLGIFHSLLPLLILYSLMKGATAFFLYAITRHITNERLALILLVLYILYPANYGEGTSALSELPFMFFIMLGMYLFIVRKWFLAGGMMFAIANWFRPMAIIFLLALLIYSLLKWKNSLKLIVGYVAMIAIIGTATMHRTGLFLYQAKTGWMALMDYSSNHAPESMQIRDRNDWNVSQKDSAWQAAFIGWLKEHPSQYVRQMPEKLVNTYVSDNVNMCTFVPEKAEKEYMYDEVSLQTIIRNAPHLTSVQWLTVVNLLIYYTLLLLAAMSLRYFRRETHLLPLSILLLGTALLLLVGHGEARFHIPFMPFIMMMAATFIYNKYGIKDKH